MISSLFCAVVCFVTLQVAMASYQDTEGDFEISRNFISDLGTEDETYLLLVFAMLMAAIAVGLFWIITVSMFSAENFNLRAAPQGSGSSGSPIDQGTPPPLLRYSSYLGLASSIFIPLIGLFAVDEFPDVHNAVTSIFFIAMTLAMLGYSFTICVIHWKNVRKTTTVIDDIGFVALWFVLIPPLYWIFPATELLTPALSLVIFFLYLFAVWLLRRFWQKYLKFLTFSFSYILSISMAIFIIYLPVAIITDIFVLSQEIRSVVEICYVYLMILWMTGLLMLTITKPVTEAAKDST
ncbi:MAG: hypothetical protein ACFFGZ_00970 [Candidatus Thorarchaeota archaeon]